MSIPFPNYQTDSKSEFSTNSSVALGLPEIYMSATMNGGYNYTFKNAQFIVFDSRKM